MEKNQKISELEELAKLLDSKFRTPFGFRIGWDAILGLIPGIGASITTLLSAFIIYRGLEMGTSMRVLFRMVLNVLIDNLFGAIPLLGWIGDIFWKSNEMNVALLRSYARDPHQTTLKSGLVLGSALVVVSGVTLALTALAGALTWILARTLYGILSSGLH